MKDAAARVTSKGQVTIPKAVRDALGIDSGDSLLFRLEGDRVVLTRTPDFIDLAGSVPVPHDVADASWPEIRDRARRALGEKYR